MKSEKNHKVHLSDKQLQLIEKIGVMHSKEGMQPSSARILALLMVCDKTELTFDEIRETLELSKSATSNAINTLLQIQHIDYITKTGDRKRYFKSTVDMWKMQFAKQFDRLTKFSDLLEEIYEARTSQTIEMNQSIAELIDFIKFFLNEIPIIYEKWEQVKK